jgi:hypothetical protein
MLMTSWSRLCHANFVFLLLIKDIVIKVMTVGQFPALEVRWNDVVVLDIV